MIPRHWVAAGAFTLFVAVALGAFGAHGLKQVVGPEQVAIWTTGVHYQALHGLGLIAHGLWRERAAGGATPAWLFSAGILCFSGSLYGLALGAPSWVGPLTPLGGVLFLAGWLAFGAQALRR
ncbi:MAG: DUF423 domain-containing protein [Planctomycetes bacterium]|nr:DUF423 domain-containing protein [Planctomycetota bacterium]